VTNAINIAQELSSGNADVTIIGGSFRRLTLSLVDDNAFHPGRSLC